MDDGVQEVSYEFVKSILSSFDKMLSELKTREQQKRLLHMLISKITINKVRDIESIELNINDNLIMYLNNGGESSPDGGGSPSFILRKNIEWSDKMELLEGLHTDNFNNFDERYKLVMDNEIVYPRFRVPYAECKLYKTTELSNDTVKAFGYTVIKDNINRGVLFCTGYVNESLKKLDSRIQI